MLRERRSCSSRLRMRQWVKSPKVVLYTRALLSIPYMITGPNQQGVPLESSVSELRTILNPPLIQERSMVWGVFGLTLGWGFLCSCPLMSQGLMLKVLMIHCLNDINNSLSRRTFPYRTMKVITMDQSVKVKRKPPTGEYWRLLVQIVLSLHV